MSEARLWKYLAEVLGGVWEAQRHEDRYSVGVPDVSYATDHHGWIELKKVKRPRPGGLVTIPHFTPAQRNWAKRFGKKCGGVWVLVQVDRSFFLFGWWSVDRIGRMTEEEMRSECHASWEGRIDPEAFIRSLSRINPLSSTR